MPKSKSNKPPAKRSGHASPKTKHKHGTKRDMVISLLCRPEGATVAVLMKKTGWQPHTVRSLISRLSAQGHHKLTSNKSEESRDRVYRITGLSPNR